MANYDILGNIAVVKFPYGMKVSAKKREASRILKLHKSVETVVEKLDKVKGRLRTVKVKSVLGVKTKEALYKENECVFRFNVETCYFSPRLSNERKEMAKKVKRGERVLVMFGGVGPFAIVMSKFSKAKEVVNIELSRACYKYAKDNVKRNKVENLELIQGDVKKKLPLGREKFNVIIMARPNLKYSFLKEALSVSKKGTWIYYHAFCNVDDLGDVVDKLEAEAVGLKRKIKIVGKKRIGEIAPYKFRYRIEIKVLN